MERDVRDGRPRAFDPSYAAGEPPPTEAPGWDVGPERQIGDGRTLARGLAWFSIGLGLAEIMAPERFTEMFGVDERHASLVRAYGLREIASGVAILAQRHPVPGVWSRVAGDAIDLATLGAALNSEGAHRGRIAGAMSLVAGVTALDVLCAGQLHGRMNAGERA